MEVRKQCLGTWRCVWLSSSICLVKLDMDRYLPTLQCLFLQLNKPLYFKVRLHHILGGRWKYYTDVFSSYHMFQSLVWKRGLHRELFKKMAIYQVVGKWQKSFPTTGHCRCECLGLKNKTNTHCMEDREKGRARRTEGQMTWLAKIFISW